MSTTALGLGDLVDALPVPAVVVDQWARTVCANAAWANVDTDVTYLLSTDAEVSASVGAIRAVLSGPSREASAHLSLGDPSDPQEPRFAELRIVEIGDGAGYFLLTCRFLDDVALESSVLLDRHTVTGVPGLRLLGEHLTQAMAMAGRYPYRPGVFAVEVDGLDDVERDYGIAARRELVVAMASRLRSGLRPSDVVAQPSDERFLIMLPDLDSPESAHVIAQRLCIDQAQPFRVGANRVEVSVRVGVALSDATSSADRVITDATAALEHTVASGGAGEAAHAVAVAGDENRGPRRSSVAERHIDLRDMKNEELLSYFQPIFDISDLRVVAGEALMRWRHPHYGVLSAGEFLSLAINSGMLATLTDQALVRATETWADFRDQLGARPPKLFVNLSPDQLLSRVAVDRLYHLLVATGLPSSDVVVEVTEEAMATRFGEMISVLNELRSQGLHVALDDFGSGYSSLGRLRHLPVDVIKVDQTMVRGLEADRRARQLLAAVATMANELDVDCIVEGIETAGEAQIVADLGFRFVQGYHFGRPCPASEFVNLVNARSATPIAL